MTIHTYDFFCTKKGNVILQNDLLRKGFQYIVTKHIRKTKSLQQYKTVH